jgi:hypothetical protein
LQGNCWLYLHGLEFDNSAALLAGINTVPSCLDPDQGQAFRSFVTNQKPKGLHAFMANAMNFAASTKEQGAE